MTVSSNMYLLVILYCSDGSKFEDNLFEYEVMKPGAWLIASIANKIHYYSKILPKRRGTFIINNDLTTTGMEQNYSR